VVVALTERRLQRLTECYLTLSLADIATQVGLSGGAPAAQEALVAMVRKGSIAATIDQRGGMVRFADVGAANAGGDEPGSGGASAAAEALATAARLEEAIAGVVGLAQRVEALDVAMSKNPTYLRHKGLDGRFGGSAGAPFSEGPDDEFAFGYENMS